LQHPGALGRGDEIFRPSWGGTIRFFSPAGAMGRDDEIFGTGGRDGAMHWLRTTTLLK